MEDSRESVDLVDQPTRRFVSPPPEEVAQLVHQAKDGRTDAFGKLVEIYRQPIINLAYQIVGSRSDAEDVAQEAFIRAFQRLAEYREESRFFSWLYRIATNAALDRLRRRKVLPTSLHEDLPGWAEDGESESTRDTRLAVSIAMDKLPPEQRVALVLRELHGLSYVDIAEITGVAVGTVGSRIRSARQFLYRALRGAF